MIKGIDVSYCQSGFDFAAAKKAGVEFVIVRAGISTRTDTQLASHMPGIKANRLKYGFYWYSRAFSVADAKSEAVACIGAVKKYAPTFPIFYDMEEQEQIDKLDKPTRTAIITAFCEAIKAAGYTAGIYLNPAWLENYVDKTELLKKYPLWLAHWSGSPDKPSKYNYGQVMWQWGIDKIGGKEVDGDIAIKDFGAAAKPPAVIAKKRLDLDNVGLYASSVAKTPVRYISGAYYCYDGVTVNGMTRICPSAASVGKIPLVENVTGWVKTADIK